MRLGVDFDNTIVRYDDVFGRIARDRGLIPPDLPPHKQSVRDHLRGNGMEEAWIHLQGEVYGPGMRHALPFDGVLEALAAFRAAAIPVYIISHRTKFPYRGPRHDLHAAAGAWIRTMGESAGSSAGLDLDGVYFELTKEAKLDRIRQCGCTHFIDDLPEFLSHPDFPAGIERLLFDPAQTCRDTGGVRPFGSWRRIREHLLQ